MISVWPKFRAFDPEMVLHFHFTFKPFSGHAQKRERARERERGRKKEERVEIVQSWARRYRPKPSSPISFADITGTTPIAIARSVRIWWFFSGFCLCFEEWMILYICLVTEKMWAISRKCVFYGIFKNTTKYHKIFFETFFEMQPNTWKHFPFRKIAFLENRIFSGNTFTRTKRSLRLLHKGWTNQLVVISHPSNFNIHLATLISHYATQHKRC